MGLLDSVIGALGQGAGGQQNPQSALISAIVSMIAQGGGGSSGGGLGGMLGSALGGATQGGGAGGLGGLGGLVEQFARHGMGDIAKSWVGTGQNLPISAEQLQSVLGSGQVAQLAESVGLSHSDTLQQLSSLLPQVVDHLTPNGQLPAGGGGFDLGSLGALAGQLLGGNR